jgi:hypothetical protein
VTPSTKRWLLRLLQLVLLVAVAVGLYRALAGQLSQLTWEEVRQAGTPAPGALLLSTIMLLGVYLLHALLWQRITADVGGGSTSLRAGLHAYFVSSLGRYIPGKLWQLAGLAVLSGRAGLVPSRAVAASLFAQLGFLTTGLIFLGITLPDLAPRVNGDSAVGLNPITAASVLAVASAMAIWLLAATRLGRSLHAWAERRLGARMGQRVAATLAIADEVEPGRALVWAAGYAGSWLLFGGAFVIFVQAFAPVPHEHLLATAGTVAAAYLAGYLFILAPAGLGMREAAMVLLLAQFLTPGVAAVVAVLSRVWFTAGELLPLALIPLLPRAKAAPSASGVL